MKLHGRALFLISILALLGTQFSAQAKESSKFEMGTFDVFAAPNALAGGGTYSVSGIDHGRMGLVLYGGKLGVKLGPLLVGGEYLEGHTSAESAKESVGDSSRYLYPMPDQEKVRAYGLVVGFAVKRLSVWYSHYPYETMKKNAIVAGNTFTHTYHGSGSAVEAKFRVWNMIHVGGYYHTQSFKKYTSDYSAGLADKANLDPALNASTYGITLSYLVPFSKLHEMTK